MNQASGISGRMIFQAFAIDLLGPEGFSRGSGVYAPLPLENPERGTWAVAMKINYAAPHFLISHFPQLVSRTRFGMALWDLL